ncbi:hypothetical protein [Streptomyces sp. RerS4]|uniref:hypothetical protein n=1 Tax=Streptomyces sp. RerS4 TaxID=2942449 RepID=UPI00201BFF81|nr:hypothetical protein [Streptomyces sp. RerS4]UQX02508.1 hypothetical protein M4D82_19960 [Streptomyces sp. RerS4]
MASRGSRGSSGEWDKPFWLQRGWQISAAFLLAMVLIGGYVALIGDDDTENNAGTPQSPAKTSAPANAPSSPPASGTTEGRPAGCSTDDRDQAVPSQSPADLKWKVYQTDLLPVSPSAGPLKFDGAVWSCYARTPLGATLAMQAISAKMGGADWKTVSEKQMAKGPGRDQFVAARAKEATSQRTGAPGSRGSYVGFRVLTFSKDQATGMILMRLADGTYGVATMSTVWEDGDWKLRPTLDGSVTEGLTAVGGPDGFILWGSGNAS